MERYRDYPYPCSADRIKAGWSFGYFVFILIHLSLLGNETNPGDLRSPIRSDCVTSSKKKGMLQDIILRIATMNAR